LKHCKVLAYSEAAAIYFFKNYL